MAVAPHCARPPEPRQATNPNNPAGGFYRRLPEAALADRRLNRTALALLAQLDAYARQKAECWPSVATLAEALGVCERTIQYALAHLKRYGYVEERPATNPTHRVLILLWKQGVQAPPAECKPYSQGMPREGANRFRPKQRQALEGKKAVRSALLKTPEPEPLPVPKPAERRPTEAERTQCLREWVDAIPAGTPLARKLAARLAERLKA